MSSNNFPIMMENLKHILLYSSFISILGIMSSFLIFLPLMILGDHGSDHITMSNKSIEAIHEALDSNLYVHTCIGALCCTFPLFCEHILDISMAKFKTTTIAQSCLLLAIVVPSLVLYQASLSGHVTVGLYSAATSSQDLLYFGAILSFHSHFSKANSSKISMLVIYIFFSVGVMLAAFFNIGVVPVALNYIGLFAVLIGVIGIYLSFLIRLYEHVSHLWSLYQCVEPNSILNQHTIHNIRDNLYLYILIMNLTFRLLLFQLISPGDADSRAIHGQPYYIMFNTISVVFLSIINSRQLKMKYFQIQHRFETKRNFVRYISHEIRTPLNCVQIGIELALQYLKRNNTNHPLILETTPRALETPFHRSSIFSSQSLDGVVDNQDIIFQEPDQAIIELLEDTNLSCLTAVEILNDILSYDKLEASDMKLNYSVIDVKSLLERCVAPFAIQAQQKNVSLQFKDPSLIEPYLSTVKVSVDINRFGQVIRNIISNALKFTPAGGVISVSASEIKNVTPSTYPVAFFSSHDSTEPRNEEHTYDIESNIAMPRLPGNHNILRIDIKDTGPGITKEQQKTLLNEVVQFHDPLSTNVNGAGLGLWISRSIIDLHGGTLSVTSEGIPGQGCTFTICLVVHSYENLSSPLPTSVGLSSASQDFPTPTPQESPPLTSNYSEQFPVPEIRDPTLTPLPIALCVDDSSLNRKFIGRFLGSYFRVIDCINGSEAVEYVRRTVSTSDYVSIIFMDNVMPIMDGLEATSIIRSIGYTGPIIGVTGNCLPEQIEEFSRKGATVIVQKPLKLETFGKLIVDVLGDNAPEGLKILNNYNFNQSNTNNSTI